MKQILPTLLIAGILAACSGTPAVPKPEAWPRIEAYPPTYTMVDGFALNDSAVVSYPAEGQLSAAYPRYGATLYLTRTATPTERQQQEVIDNRTERMALNTGGADTEITELMSTNGYACRLLVTPLRTATPVQFIAVGKKDVVSGSIFLPKAATAPSDSLTPTIDALTTDILYALKLL